MTFIRRAKEQDIDILIDLYDAFHQFHVQGVPDRLCSPEAAASTEQAEIRKALSAILQREDAIIIVALIDEQIIGLAEAYLREDEPHSLRVMYRFGYLQSLIVLAPLRNLGIGKLLTVAAQEWAKERGATEMGLDTWEFEAGPLHFYERLGYRTLKRCLTINLSEGLLENTR